MSYLQATALVRLGSDPETKTLASGTSVTACSAAVNETWYDKHTNEKREKTTWMRLNIWGKRGETFAQYLQKGSQVLVVGTVEAKAFMGQDGEPRASLEFKVDEFRFVDNGNGGNSGGSNRSDSYDDYAPTPQELDDIPF